MKHGRHWNEETARSTRQAYFTLDTHSHPPNKRTRREGRDERKTNDLHCTILRVTVGVSFYSIGWLDLIGRPTLKTTLIIFSATVPYPRTIVLLIIFCFCVATKLMKQSNLHAYCKITNAQGKWTNVLANFGKHGTSNNQMGGEPVTPQLQKA